ncbi:hypothetical protein JAAARDRAFT_41453 [Jaapia argillacea MUCL 33604]|uniref:Uncharacterized protein n=1 Tax=Jaapia argillacea MUCL 33604 TaxID=933084 RepID=A0A067P8S8_9AGAM|nr:hypothetical protein JAAARDRAFT_41453 [Jaapia argillacea MUCL 33604]
MSLNPSVLFLLFFAASANAHMMGGSSYSWGGGPVAGTIIGGIVFLMILFLIFYCCFILICCPHRRTYAAVPRYRGASSPWGRWVYTGAQPASAPGPVEAEYGRQSYGNGHYRDSSESGHVYKSPQQPLPAHINPPPPGLEQVSHYQFPTSTPCLRLLLRMARSHLPIIPNL